MSKTCVIYHGLGSRPAISRTQLLNKAGYSVISELFDYDSEWDLDEGKSLFESQLEIAKDVDLIIGISFGGYLGYKLSKATGKDLILINPALDRAKSKSMIKEFDIPDYNLPSNIEVFFGEFDTSVPKEYAMEYFKNKGEDFRYHIVKDMNHRVPDNYFKHIIFNSFLVERETPNYKTLAEEYSDAEEMENYIKWCWENRDKLSQFKIELEKIKNQNK